MAGAGGSWNPSQDDPWWRDWLTSRELFAVYHEVIPRIGTPIGSLLNGTIFTCEESRCQVEVWVSPAEVVVAYPVWGPQYTSPSQQREALPEFEGWIDHLRHSEPLPLGRVRGRSSYGATGQSPSATAHAVKWAQAGDWAALARLWRHDRPALEARA